MFPNTSTVENILRKYPNIKRDVLGMIEDFDRPESEIVKDYTKLIKELEFVDPDSSFSIERMKDGLRFVFDFCVEHQLTFEQYQTFQTGPIPNWVDHLKKHEIYFYTLHALTFPKNLVEFRILEFIIPDFFMSFQKTRNKFYASKLLKDRTKLIIQDLNKLLSLE